MRLGSSSSTFCMAKCFHCPSAFNNSRDFCKCCSNLMLSCLGNKLEYIWIVICEGKYRNMPGNGVHFCPRHLERPQRAARKVPTLAGVNNKG